MDLGLTLGSLIAIMILALLAAKMFPNTGRLDGDRVTRNLKRYAPEVEISDVFFDATGKVALAALTAPDASVGLVRLMGDRAVCRLLTRGDIRTTYKDHARITLALHDFTQPEITLTMPSSDQNKVAALLDAITKETEALNAA